MQLVIGSMDACGHITSDVAEAAKRAKTVVLQTAVGSALDDMDIAYKTLDSIYQSAQDFDALEDGACEWLMDDGTLFLTLGSICSNRIAAKAVKRVRAAGGSVSVIPDGDKALCNVFAAGAADAVSGAAFYTASSFERAADTNITVVIGEIDSRLLASALKLKLMRQYGDEYSIFLTDTRSHIVQNIPLYCLDAAPSYGYYTSVVMPPCPLEQKQRFTFCDLVDVMARLCSPNGCPWDKEQTHESLKRYLIEESYEVLEAIDDKDADALYDELGDVLLQVVFHARIAQQQGDFDITDITTAICSKMISRHTHIFGNATADTPNAVIDNWEQIKKDEKDQRSQTEVLESVPKSMPALMRSGKVQHKAAHVGFDFCDAAQAMDKLKEEMSEVMQSSGRSDLFEECGDLLFSAVNVVRMLGIEPETALQKATDKFIKRFGAVEKLAAEQGINMSQSDMQTLDMLWNTAKKQV